jgi:integrase
MVTPATHLALVTTDRARPRRTPFDVKTLKHLKPPPKRLDTHGHEVVNQITYWDATTKGFGLRISSAKTKTWIWMGRILKQGRRVVTRYHLGTYSEKEDGAGLSLAMARRKAHEYQRAVDRGEDPGQQRQDAKTEALTRSTHDFKSVAERFLALHHPKKKATLSPHTKRRYHGLLLGQDLKDWWARPVASLTTTHVTDALDRMERRDLTLSVNRLRTVLKKFFSWCIQRQIITVSPAAGLEPRMAEVVRTRHLYGNADAGTPSELALLWRACEDCGRSGLLVKLLLLTAQRREEVANLRWKELLDLDGTNPRWHIPAERSKTNKPHTVPLCPLTVALLRTLPAVPRQVYVFAATGAKRELGFSYMKRTIDARIAALKASEPDQYRGQFESLWRFHDLRRTAETAMAELGVAREIRDAILNHAQDKIQAAYNQADHGPAKRDALTRWERHLTGLIAPAMRKGRRDHGR